jgi:F-type H+-transporting ATPase subunit alpha
MVELLKQPQYAPMAVEDQIVLIFAGTFGYLDDVPLSDVARFEREYLPFIRERYPEIPSRIRDTGDLSQETQDALKKAIGEFKDKFFRPAAAEGHA